jgi:hypothetical protein
VGGEREALCEPDAKWGTTDEGIAGALFAARVTALQEKRRGRIGADGGKRHTTLDVLVRDHLKQKHKAGKTSWSHMVDLEQRLGAALEHFGSASPLPDIAGFDGPGGAAPGGRSGARGATTTHCVPKRCAARSRSGRRWSMIGA